MSGIVNTQKVDVAKCSHLVLDRDGWYTNFAHYKKSEREILFFVSGGRQLCRWVGYVLSLGISTVGGNRLSEMSVEVQGEESEAILQEFVDEYERNQNGITPPNIKSTIKRCNWFVVDYDRQRRFTCVFERISCAYYDKKNAAFREQRCMDCRYL